MTLEELANRLRLLEELVRRHSHDAIETDRLPFSSFKDWGTSQQVLTSRGSTLAPDWNLTGVSPSASASRSMSPSASQSPSASRSPSSSVSPSI